MQFEQLVYVNKLGVIPSGEWRGRTRRDRRVVCWAVRFRLRNAACPKLLKKMLFTTEKASFNNAILRCGRFQFEVNL